MVVLEKVGFCHQMITHIINDPDGIAARKMLDAAALHLGISMTDILFDDPEEYSITISDSYDQSTWFEDFEKLCLKSIIKTSHPVVKRLEEYSVSVLLKTAAICDNFEAGKKYTVSIYPVKSTATIADCKRLLQEKESMVISIPMITYLAGRLTPRQIVGDVIGFSGNHSISHHGEKVMPYIYKPDNNSKGFDFRPADKAIGNNCGVMVVKPA